MPRCTQPNTRHSRPIPVSLTRDFIPVWADTKQQWLFSACYNMTLVVCVSQSNTELSVDFESGRITKLLNPPPPPPPLDLEKDADSQTANIGPAERSGVTRMGCCSLTGYSWLSSVKGHTRADHCNLTKNTMYIWGLMHKRLHFYGSHGRASMSISSMSASKEQKGRCWWREKTGKSGQQEKLSFIYSVRYTVQHIPTER